MTRPKHRFYGRRKGKTLTAYRQSLLDRELPKYLIHSMLSSRAESRDLKTHKISPLTLFGRDDNELWLEIGFGNGEFLAHMSQAEPDIQFIGCEPFMNGVAALLAYLHKPVENLKIWNDDARLLMDVLPAQSIDRVYLLNPDPWPKKRHEKRRFINQKTLGSIARILKKDGLFIASTDVRPLADYMHGHLETHPAFKTLDNSEGLQTTPPEDWPLDKTRYMKKALGGEVIYWLQYKRK